MGRRGRRGKQLLDDFDTNTNNSLYIVQQKVKRHFVEL